MLGSLSRLVWGSQLRRNTLSGGVVAVINIVLLLLSYPIYLSYLGAKWYGLWATLSIVIAFSQMGNLGINNAVARYVAEACGRRDAEDIWKLTGASLGLVLVPCLLVVLVCTSFSSGISNILGLDGLFLDTAQSILPAIGILSALILLVDVLKGVVIGIGKMDIANYIFITGRAVQFAVSVALIIVGYGLVGLLYGASAGYLLMGAGYITYLMRQLDGRPLSLIEFSKEHVKRLLGFGVYMASSSLVSILMDPFNKIVLARYVGLEFVTFYEIGLKGVQTVRTIYEGAIKAIMPRISELSVQGAKAKVDITRIHRKSIHLVLMTAVPMFIILFFLGDVILKVWIGDAYSECMTLSLRWYCVGYTVNLLSVPGFYVLLGLNHSKYSFYAALLRSLAHFVVIISLLMMGISVSINMIVSVHVLAMIGAALFIMVAYLRVVGRIPAYSSDTTLQNE